MKGVPFFIGDEAAAAGYRLAGFETRCCEPGETRRVLEQLVEEGTASLILVAAPHASRAGEAMLMSLTRALDPPVTVVHDAAATEAPPDLARRVRAELGVGS